MDMLIKVQFRSRMVIFLNFCCAMRHIAQPLMLRDNSV
jgi:hypothetical protein